MNIFAVSDNPVECAIALDDLRLNKMILETAQLLSTAIRHHGYTGDLAYKSTHANHPCSVWARTSRGNYEWLLEYFYNLVFEKLARTGKEHKSYRLYWVFKTNSILIPGGDRTPFANCTPHKSLPVLAAYRLTLRDKWANDKRPPTWKLAQKPSWA